MALTYLKKGGPSSFGAAAIEPEVLDSQTGEQLGALREVQKGKGSPSAWDDAKHIMDDWARRFSATLEERHAHGPRPPVFSPPPEGRGG